MNIIENANLPHNKVSHIILGIKYKELLNDFFIRNDIRPIYISDNPYVDRRISGHADLSVLHLCNNKIMVSDYLFDSIGRTISENTGVSFDICKAYKTQTKNYPDDANLNVCIINDKAILNKKTADKEIVDILTNKEIKILNCNQGYTRCSICVVSENAIITEDDAIERMCIQNNISVLKIKESVVQLPGFSCGFIGGASFKVATDKIVFTGMIKSIPIRNEIESFAEKNNVEVIYATKNDIIDIGSAIPIIEV